MRTRPGDTVSGSGEATRGAGPGPPWRRSRAGCGLREARGPGAPPGPPGPCDHHGVPRRVSSIEFVGRGPELAALTDALDRADSGEFAAIFLAGDSGVGKSRLLLELEHAAEARGVRVVAGDCVALGEGEFPYAPVVSALRGLARELDHEELEGLLGPAREELARLVP